MLCHCFCSMSLGESLHNSWELVECASVGGSNGGGQGKFFFHILHPRPTLLWLCSTTVNYCLVSGSLILGLVLVVWICPVDWKLPCNTLQAEPLTQEGPQTCYVCVQYLQKPIWVLTN